MFNIMRQMNTKIDQKSEFTFLVYFFVFICLIILNIRLTYLPINVDDKLRHIHNSYACKRELAFAN